MSPAPVRRLRDVRLADAPEVGGKAASLGELLATGLRVPDGFVVTAAAMELPAAERHALVREGAAGLGGGPFAVRSSGIAEDGADHSYAGMYETVLNVEVDELAAATDRIHASARTERVAGYQATAVGGDARMAVIVQRMVAPVAAGVALTADPINGNRRACVITAVHGTGDRLVSGKAIGDEWVVLDGDTRARRQPEGAINRRQAERVATEARQIAESRGAPQDIEWAIDAESSLWILQARPMTALPPDVSWEAPAPGAFTRQLRFGEWISAPVTPLFESWLLSRMEERMHAFFLEEVGQRAPLPHHVVVNGWYFYSVNWLSPASLARSLPGILSHLIRSPRKVAGVLPPTVRHSFRIMEREWRGSLRPRYRGAVEEAEGEVETLPVTELPGLIDELADLAGESFGWIAALSGAAYKLEINLAGFYRRHLRRSLGGSHMTLLSGFEAPSSPPRHAVVSLDWADELSPAAGPARSATTGHARLVAARQAAEEAAFGALASSPRRLRAFRRLLADAQHLVPLREEQVGEFTLAWPAMRRAVLRIGEALTARGVIASADDVFFLTRDEAFSALQGRDPAPRIDVTARRAIREEQSRLVPPLLIGRLNPLVKKLVDSFPMMVGAARSDTALASGSPASPGRATGAVRVIRGPQQFDELQAGEILVAPLTAPAWTPLFTRAAAVVTDVGSAAAHASIIAREYGIPAVVGCGDATARLRTGLHVTVDGNTGNVEAASPVSEPGGPHG